MGTGSFPGVKCGRACCWPLTPFWCCGHGTVQLYLYPPSGPHRACNEITLPFNKSFCSTHYQRHAITPRRDSATTDIVVGGCTPSKSKVFVHLQLLVFSMWTACAHLNEVNITVLSTRRIMTDWLPRRRWNRIISFSHFWSMPFSFCHG